MKLLHIVSVASVIMTTAVPAFAQQQDCTKVLLPDTQHVISNVIQ